MKYLFLYIALIISTISSCSDNQHKSKKIDQDYEKLTKLSDNELTRVEIPNIIYLDTINESEKEISIPISNIGEKELNHLKIKFHCTCISQPNYNVTIKPNDKQIIKLIFPIDKKGNFSYPIRVYGNFYPYLRKIYVEGYRK